MSGSFLLRPWTLLPEHCAEQDPWRHAGVVMGALSGAATSLLEVIADPYDQLPAITFRLLGSLASTTGPDLGPVLPAVALGLVPLILLRWRINLLSLGDDEARTLGVDAPRVRLLVIAAATLITASVVATAGVVGWVGLVIPHIARMIVRPSFATLLPVSAILLGARATGSSSTHSAGPSP